MSEAKLTLLHDRDHRLVMSAFESVILLSSDIAKTDENEAMYQLTLRFPVKWASMAQIDEIKKYFEVFSVPDKILNAHPKVVKTLIQSGSRNISYLEASRKLTQNAGNFPMEKFVDLQLYCIPMSLIEKQVVDSVKEALISSLPDLIKYFKSCVKAGLDVSNELQFS